MAFFLYLKKSIIIVIITQHVPLLFFCIGVVFLHIPEDDNFYLVCRQNQFLTLPLHSNTYRMEHLDHENLFYAFFPRFQLAIGVLTFFFYWFCRQFFKFLWLNLISNLFILRRPLFFLRKIEWHCIGRIFIVLWHAITKNIFRILDRQWYRYLINLTAYNITTVFSIIAWYLISTLFTSIVYIVYIVYQLFVFDQISTSSFINTFLISAYQMVKKSNLKALKQSGTSFNNHGYTSVALIHIFCIFNLSRTYSNSRASLRNALSHIFWFLKLSGTYFSYHGHDSTVLMHISSV